VTYDVQSPDVARLWGYSPDWRGGFSVRRSFKTDIARSRNNTEQRRALRTVPRISAEYSTVASGDDFRDAKHFLRAWQNKPAIIPHFAAWTRLTGSSAFGATTLTVNPLPVWAVAGQNLILCGEGVQERVLVASVAGTTITLEDNLAAAWPTGSVLRPTLFGLFNGTTRASRRNRGAGEFRVAIDCYPGGEPPRTVGTAWATLGSREVFTPIPDYAGVPSVSAIWPVEQVDYGQGRTAQFRPIEEGQQLVEADFRGLTVTTAGELEQFFDRHLGRRNAFYLPTWEQDYVLAATALSGSSAFLASGSAVATDFGALDFAEIEEGVAVYLTNGTAIYRRITDIAASGGNSLITVSAAWGAELTTANVARICRLLLCRFGSDEMTTSWVTPLSAECRLAFQSVRA
jgi:hypothetical protein